MTFTETLTAILASSQGDRIEDIKFLITEVLEEGNTKKEHHNCNCYQLGVDDTIESLKRRISE